MFALNAKLLETMRSFTFGYEPVLEGPNILLLAACKAGCSGTCKTTCRGKCKGLCKGTCKGGGHGTCMGGSKGRRGGSPTGCIRK